jgi:hypothetical protein
LKKKQSLGDIILAKPIIGVRSSMSPQQVLLISMVLYVTVPLRMIIRGWFLCAGLAMLLIAQLPIIWQVHFSDSETPGFALLAILLSTPALALLVGRAGVLVIQRLRKGRPWARS